MPVRVIAVFFASEQGRYVKKKPAHHLYGGGLDKGAAISRNATAALNPRRILPTSTEVMRHGRNRKSLLNASGEAAFIFTTRGLSACGHLACGREQTLQSESRRRHGSKQHRQRAGKTLGLCGHGESVAPAAQEQHTPFDPPCRRDPRTHASIRSRVQRPCPPLPARAGVFWLQTVSY